jgi:hypothetical protein
MAKSAPDYDYGASHSAYYEPDPKATSNILKDYSNFLSCAPQQYFNLKPSADGKITEVIPDLQNYSQLLIVGCNGDSVVQRVVSVKELLQQEATPVPKRNLTIIQEQQDENKALIDQRESTGLREGATTKIQDILSSKFYIVDNLKKALRIIDSVHSKVG